MKLSDEKTVEHLITVFRDDGGIYAKKMFGCYCVILIWSLSAGPAMEFFLKNVGRNVYVQNII